MFETHVLDFQRGDEDDTLTCRVTEANNQDLVSLNFFISGELANDDERGKSSRIGYLDTSDYPSRHTFFCHASEECISSTVSRVVESLSEEPSRTIEDMLQRLLTVLARKLDAPESDDDTDEDMDGDFIDYDGNSDDGLGVQSIGREQIDRHLLQRCARGLAFASPN